MDKRSLSFGVTKSDKGAVADDAPYGWVEGIANAYICDRYDELVLPTAFSEAATKFMLNPVLSHGHNIDGNPVSGGLPAGSVLKIWQDAQGNTHHRSRWANTAEAQKTRGLYNDGDMRGFSVQFITLDSRQPTPEEVLKWPTLRRVITKLDLIELACAVVPVNQGSLTTASKSLASVRKLAVPTEEDAVPKQAFTPDQTKQLGDIVKSYNAHAENMAGVATALEELQSKASTEDDHAPRMKALTDAHSSLMGSCKDMGDTSMALAKSIGADGEEVEPEEGADPEAAVQKEAEKTFTEAFEKALKA